MTDPNQAWWVGQQVDWTQGDPAKVVELLSRAYDDPAEMKRITELAQVPLPFQAERGAVRESWHQVLIEAAQRGAVLDVVAEVLHDGATRAFHPMLDALLGSGLPWAYAMIATRHGLVPRESAGRNPVLESLRTLRRGPEDEPVGALQAIADAYAGLDDPHPIIEAVLAATNRTAMIEVGGVPNGTGFLVGPDLVLTAGHVVKAATTWPPSPLPEVRAVFDYLSEPGHSPAESGKALKVIAFLAGSPPSPAERSGSAYEWNPPDGCLDFALLKLCGPVPEPPNSARRDFYQLNPASYDFPASPMLFVLQHPLRQFQKLTWLRSHPEVNSAGTRIRYAGITLGGSSGSPVIDTRGRLVAMHHYSDAEGNQAVPVSAVAKALKADPANIWFTLLPSGELTAAHEVLADTDVFNPHLIAGHAFVNRQNLRSQVSDMAKRPDGRRTLAILGELGSGVSFSYKLVSHVAGRSKKCAELCRVAPGGLVTFLVDIADYVAFTAAERREKIISDILLSFGLRELNEPLAQEARNLTTLKQWLSWKLKGSDQQWWIFFDSFNLPTDFEHGIGELISALMTIANDEQVPLRVILAGLAVEEYLIEKGTLSDPDVAAGLARADVEQWMRAAAAAEKRTVDETLLEGKLASLFPAGQPPPEPRRLAPRLPLALIDVLEAN